MTTALLLERLQTFVTIFLGIFIEAAPFLLAGSLVSGFIELFLNRDALLRFTPRRALPASLLGASLGLIFPVCECGVVPVTRRLYQKGLPMPIGIAFLLAAPVINPVVMFSTWQAFGGDLGMVAARVGLGVVEMEAVERVGMSHGFVSLQRETLVVSFPCAGRFMPAGV